MVSDKKCCVPGCLETGASHQVLHVFPNPKKFPDRFEAWRKAVGGEILQLPDGQVYKYRRVCHAHFEEKFHCRYNRLSNIAVPSIHLPDNPRISTSEFKENTPEIPLICGYISEPRKRPFMSIENVMDCLPSTSKDLLDQGAKLSQNVIHDSPPKKTLKVKALTLAENMLNKKLVAAKMKLSKLKTIVKKQAASIKIAKNILRKDAMVKALEGLPPRGKLVTMLQFRELKKKEKGRRFTTEEKLVALSLLKQSPKGYRLLRKMLILPAPQTLNKLLSMANIHTGINTNIFSQMKVQAEKMQPAEKLCVLLFDEMALKTNLTYSEKFDKVIGFVDNGEVTTKEFADHAQVFMIRGLVKNYKQPIGYSFSASATKGPELAKQIKLYVKQITEAGLTVVATVCDQGSGNRNAIKCLLDESRATWIRRGEEPRNNIIVIDDSEIVPLYDAPHLIKCIRNNFMVKDLKYIHENVTKVAKWSHIDCLYDESPAYQGIRLIPKLTENHVKPAKISKMRVKYATQLFSQTVAANMGYLADKKVIPEECKDTADMLLFFDNLFDSVNGSHIKNRHAKPALGPVTPHSVHHKIWTKAKKIIKTMKFVKGNKSENVPTLNNWVWTLDGMETLVTLLNKKHGVSSVWMRHLNQDPIENFFGSIRSHGCRNTNPTPERFQSAFTALLINSLSSVHAPGNNCEDDVATALHPLIVTDDCIPKESETIDFNTNLLTEINFKTLEDKFQNITLKASLQYCSGYFAKKAKAKIFKKCSQCNENLIDNKECEYIKYREYAKKRWLCSPTTDLLLSVSQMQDIIYLVILNNIEKKFLKDLIKTLILISIDFSFIKCNKHKEKLIDFMINIITRFFIYSYCKNINKILCGSRKFDNKEDELQLKANKYFDKSYKRKI